ncbi:hypothetical protein BCV70DRAFT_199699 [Testicularia cyperi]|uniref:Uncharacterized protein n=1 Tax=Testicularia cyperi TaxID=1882483 RepID=A0A317XRA5_9BASI|nr:hypothetical protein BCV70DRAFT_199699 [Testicularia cyperi]
MQFQKYKRLIKENPEQEDLLMAFECLLGDLMDCIDHPKELRDYNPFAAFADFVDAGAVIRSPECVQSASRLTLGATWSLLSPEDEKRIGYPLMLRLTRLHWYRRAAIDDILHRWSDGKFCKDSTCRACFVDPWELFLLSIPLAIVKEGTRYLDFETASDTSSSEGESDNDTDNDNDMDDHNGADEDSEAGEEVETFPPDMLTPFRQHIHPHNLVPMHPSLENYGPNAYILRVVSMDMIGFEAVPNHKKARCFACGFRFDGQEPSKLSKVWKDLSKAVETARRQIRAVPETI